MLSKTIKDFFSKFYGRNLTEKETLAIDSVIEQHAIDNAGIWLTELFEDLQGKRLNTKIKLAEDDYPNGKNGFSNLIADLKVDFGFDLGDYEDYGEGATWTIKPLGLKLFLCREGSPDYYIINSIV